MRLLLLLHTQHAEEKSHHITTGSCVQRFFLCPAGAPFLLCSCRNDSSVTHHLLWKGKSVVVGGLPAHEAAVLKWLHSKKSLQPYFSLSSILAKEFVFREYLWNGCVNSSDFYLCSDVSGTKYRWPSKAHQTFSNYRRVQSLIPW